MRISRVFAQKKMPKINVPFNSACLSHPCTRVFYHKTRRQSIKKSRLAAGDASQPVKNLLIHGCEKISICFRYA